MIWNDDMVLWIKNNKENYNNKEELLIAFNKHFNTNASLSSLENKCGKKNISLSYKQKVWTDEKLNWLIESAKIYDDREVILNEFNKKFKANIKLRALGLMCNEHKINLPKAIKRIEKNKDYLKIGHIKLRGFSEKEIGDIIFEGQKNQTFIKINNTGDKKKDYVLKNRYLYEKYHDEKLTKNDIILFLNGDNNDFSEQNLYKINRSVLSAMSGNKLHSYKSVDKMTIIKICEWNVKLQEINNMIKGE